MSPAAGHWLRQIAATIGVASIFCGADAILSRHDWRIDLTPEKRFTLADHSRQVLAGLAHPVEITAFLRSDDARNREIEDLLARMQRVTAQLRYAVVDVNRNPAVARRYGVDSYGSLVVDSDGRRAVTPDAREEPIVAAILEVTRPTRDVIYFLTGHGEHDLSSADRETGYSAVRGALQNAAYDARPLSLLGEDAVPADAGVLVIAGAQRDLLPAEVAKLDEYVARGGGLLVLLDPGTPPTLRTLLRRFGVQTAPGVIVDPENRLFGGDSFTVTVPGLSDKHPASAPLKVLPLLSGTCAVSFAGAHPGVRGIEFLHTAPSSWRTPRGDADRRGADFVTDRDQRGPISVGVSLLVDYQAGRVAEARGVPPARFIIIGDSDFANNSFIDYLGNKDLLLNSIAWLSGGHTPLAERPALRTPGVNQFFVSARQGRLAFLIGTVFEPAAVLLVGTLIVVRRRWRA
ncbi:MAG: GldG family protein [Candidatus Binatia bacterium]